MQQRVLRLLGRNLRQSREAAGILKIRLASLLNVSPAYITLLENGKRRNPTLGVLYLWAKHCNTTLAELVRGL